MKTYHITYMEKLIHDFYVDAEDEHDASDKFYAQLNNGEVDFSNGYLSDSNIKIEEGMLNE